MNFVILSKSDTYCGTVSSSVYCKLKKINNYKTVDEEFTFNLRVVKTDECDSIKLKSLIVKAKRGEI